MKRKNLLKILGLLILVGNVANAEYSGKFEKTYSKNSDYKMKITSVKSGKSKRNVSKILSNQEIDLKLIEKIGDSNYFRNKNGIYYKSGEKVLKLDGVDKDSFEVMKFGNYGKDKNSVFYHNRKLDGVKPIGFEELDERFATYEGVLFNNGKKVEGVRRIESGDMDMNGLERIRISDRWDLGYSNYFKNKDGIYYAGKSKFLKLNGADKDTFSVTFKGKYGKDKNSVYYQDKKMDGVKPSEFMELNDVFAKDRNNIYIDGKRLENFEARDFLILDEKRFEYKNKKYYYDKKSKTVKEDKEIEKSF